MVLDAVGEQLLLGCWAAFALMGVLLLLGPLALHRARNRARALSLTEAAMKSA